MCAVLCRCKFFKLRTGEHLIVDVVITTDLNNLFENNDCVARSNGQLSCITLPGVKRTFYNVVNPNVFLQNGKHDHAGLSEVGTDHTCSPLT